MEKSGYCEQIDIAAPILQEEYSKTADGNSPVTLWADTSGMFFADGKVNGKSARFLIDTGADIVTFSQIQADRLGINYENGKIGYASTASGITPIRTLKLNNISIGNITVYNIQVSVIMGRFPEVPLLGGSFLNNVNFSRTGNKMELKKR